MAAMNKMRTSRVTLQAKRDGDNWVVIVGALTFRERTEEELGEAVRDTMAILAFRIEFDDGHLRDYWYSGRD